MMKLDPMTVHQMSHTPHANQPYQNHLQPHLLAL